MHLFRLFDWNKDLSDLAFSFVVKNTFSTLTSDNSWDALISFLLQTHSISLRIFSKNEKKIQSRTQFFFAGWLGVGDIHNPFQPQISSRCVQEVYVRNSVADPGFPDGRNEKYLVVEGRCPPKSANKIGEYSVTFNFRPMELQILARHFDMCWSSKLLTIEWIGFSHRK